MRAHRAAPLWGLALPLAACVAGAAATDDPTADVRPLVAVAPFEAVASPGSPPADADAAAASDPAPRLARRLADSGRVRVVAPDALEAALGERVSGDPQARRVRHWAEEEGWDALVVGRREREDGAERVALELRSGHSGASLSRAVATLAPGPAGEAALERLAGEIEASLGVSAPPPPVATAAPPAASAAPAAAAVEGAPSPEAAEPAVTEGAADGAPGAGNAGKKGGLLGGRIGPGSGAPIEIRADELEVEERSEGRFIQFRRNVRVHQDDVSLTTDALEAFYPKGETQPDRLVARGSVRVTQRDREARCDRATYRSSDARIVCTGHAEMRQGCDVVRGNEITFELDEDRVRVAGAASVVIHPKSESAPAEGEGGAAAESCAEGSG